MKIIIILYSVISVQALIDYCVLEQCICSTNTIACSSLSLFTTGYFNVPAPDKINLIQLYDSYLSSMKFVYDFPKLNTFGLRECIVDCNELKNISEHLPELIIDASTTCSGMQYNYSKHIVQLLTNSKRFNNHLIIYVLRVYVT